MEDAAPTQTEMLGLTLSEVNKETISQFGLAPNASGLVITAVDPTSDAASNGLQAGDLISEAGQQPVTSVADFEDRVSEARDAGRKSLLILVNRDGMTRFMALRIVE